MLDMQYLSRIPSQDPHHRSTQSFHLGKRDELCSHYIGMWASFREIQEIGELFCRIIIPVGIAQRGEVSVGYGSRYGGISCVFSRTTRNNQNCKHEGTAGESR